MVNLAVRSYTDCRYGLEQPKERLTFGELSQGQNLQRAAPGEGMLLGALRMEFGEGSSKGGAARDGSGILPHPPARDFK